MRDDNCIFCKILNGDIPSRVVFEDADFRLSWMRSLQPRDIA